jgi:hypothetical protein
LNSRVDGRRGDEEKGTNMNSQTNLPDALDSLLRDLHTLWCLDNCPDDWHRADADPSGAALDLCMALWDMSRSGDEDAAAALAMLNEHLLEQQDSLA